LIILLFSIFLALMDPVHISNKHFNVYDVFYPRHCE